MLRAINTDTTHRAAQVQKHRARPASQDDPTTTKHDRQGGKDMKNERIEREAYIEFISRMLKERADLRVIKMVYEFVLHLID